MLTILLCITGIQYIKIESFFLNIIILLFVIYFDQRNAALVRDKRSKLLSIENEICFSRIHGFICLDGCQ